MTTHGNNYIINILGASLLDRHPRTSRPAQTSATYGYRYGGRLYSFASNFGGETAETLQYRGDGRLYSRTTAASTKVYRYDRGWNTIDEEDGSGNLTGTNVYAPGAEVGERLAYAFGAISGGALAYAYHDQLGSTRVWRWWNKGLVGKDDFGPYGENITACTVLPRDYALHVNDPNALLFHAAYRDYAAGWGRWTARDPLGMADGPNEYAYVGGGPVGRTDSLGLKSDCNACDVTLKSCLSDSENQYNDAVAQANVHFGTCMLGGTTACAIGCIGLGPGYPACMAVCLAGSAALCGLARDKEIQYAANARSNRDKNCYRDRLNCKCKEECP